VANETAPTPVTQPWLIRLTHWVNAVVLVIMAGSGLQILVAFPAFGPRGEPYGWYPWNGSRPPEALTIGGWLAGARHWHFAFAWILVANGLAYLVYLATSREWKRRCFLPRRDGRDALHTLGRYVRFRKQTGTHGFYNGLQRLAYTSSIALGVIEVATGLAIYKPVQLWPLAAVFGGYDAARSIHFLAMLALAAFVIGHVIMVAIHPRTIPPIVTGRELTSRSPHGATDAGTI
jgi:thiosulfate reductase cytochrome b subunit